MDEIDQILRSHYLSKFGNANWPRNAKSLLHEGRCDGNYSLESIGPPFQTIVLFTIAGHRWEIGIEIGVTQAPSRLCKGVPLILRRKGNTLAGVYKGQIQ